MARVKINRTVSRAYARRWADDRVGSVSKEVLIGARAMAPVRTGRLRGSLSITKQSYPLRVTHRVGSRVNYSALVHSGARAHPIRPRSPNGRLVFYWKKVGRVVKTRHVNHPGFTGVKYLTTPLFAVAIPKGFRVRINTTFLGSTYNQ